MPRALIVEILGNAKQFGAELDRAAQRAVDTVVALEAESREEPVPAAVPVEGGGN